MPPVPAELLSARVAAHRGRLYDRLLGMLHAFELDDLSAFTPEQREATKRARTLINQIQKGFEEP